MSFPRKWGMTTINLTIRFETFVNNLSFSRSVAQPRNAVGEAPPHEQPHVCPVPLCLSIRSKLCFGWRSHTIRRTVNYKKIQILLNVALHVQLRFATNHASSLIQPESTARHSKQSQSFSQQLNHQWQKFPLKAPDQS